MVTAKKERLSVTLGTQRGRLAYRHTTDRVDSHLDSLSIGCFSDVTSAIHTAVREEDMEARRSQMTGSAETFILSHGRKSILH
jgi:hypothetical protein